MLIIWDKCLECSVFNQDLSSWNVSNVTNMRLMFLINVVYLIKIYRVGM